MVWNDVWNDVEDIKHTDMDDNFSPRVKDVISFSKEEALRLGHDYIGTRRTRMQRPFAKQFLIPAIR